MDWFQILLLRVALGERYKKPDRYDWRVGGASMFIVGLLSLALQIHAFDWAKNFDDVALYLFFICGALVVFFSPALFALLPLGITHGAEISELRFGTTDEHL